jgi:hypothetical protein
VGAYSPSPKISILRNAGTWADFVAHDTLQRLVFVITVMNFGFLKKKKTGNILTI